ncbi:type IV pilin protein [Acinetobacter portensis]|uniref:type IV pilin protein n=1 Tax=Acinetobacter portensis TaxID=1839785 RepID=UPI002E7FBD69|nr:type IV pilin protein [Acinetobacter portensis]
MKIGNIKGLTLVELLIVIVIIAIISAIAYPSYQNNKVKVQRNDAKAEMLYIVQRMQAYKSANGTYLNATLNVLYGATITPKNGTALYNLSFQALPTASRWVLVATPIVGTVQAGDGVICINEQNQKFWAKGATNCNLSNVSDWDGR